MGNRLRFLFRLDAQIRLIDAIVLVDHKAHHAGLPPLNRPGQQGNVTFIAFRQNAEVVAVIAFPRCIWAEVWP